MLRSALRASLVLALTLLLAATGLSVTLSAAAAAAPVAAPVATAAQTTAVAPAVQAPAAPPPDPGDCTPLALGTFGNDVTVEATHVSGDAECYLVTSAGAGGYALRLQTASSAWSSFLSVYDESDALVTATARDLDPATLAAAEDYRLVVTGTEAFDGEDLAYGLGIYELTGAAGCPSMTTGWADDPTGLTWASGAEVACRSFTPSGSRVLVSTRGTEPSTEAMLFDSAGGYVCEFATSSETCALTGTAPYRVVTYVRTFGELTGSSLLSVVDLASDVGCTASTLGSFGTSAPVHAIRAPGAGPDCYLVTTGSAGPHVARWTQAANNWQLSLAVYDDDGGPVLSTTTSGVTWGSLDAATTYKLVVEGDPGALAGDYTATLLPTGSAPCPSLATGDWSGDASPLDFDDGSEVFCRTLDADAGDRLWWGTQGDDTGGPGGLVFDSLGQGICQIQSSAFYDDCLLTGTGPFRAVMVSTPFTLQWTGTGGVAAYDLASTTGCDSVDATVSMASPPITASLTGDEAVDCYLTGITPGDQVALSAVGAGARVVHPDGTSGCAIFVDGTATTCALDATGPDRVVVSSFDRALGETAAYDVALRRLVEPAGCTDLPQPSVSTTVAGHLDTAIDVDCWELDAAAGDHFAVEATLTSDGTVLPSVLIDAADGGHRCLFFFGDCSDAAATADGRHVVLVQNAGDAGDYELTIDCLTPACGPGDIEVTGAQPDELGTGAPTLVQVRGRHLDPSYTYTLVRGATEIDGEPQSVVEDGRAAFVEFDLTGAELGDWSIEVDTPEGLLTATDAVTLVAPVRARVVAELVARGKYIPGREQTVSVILRNHGNVDATATPFFLHGLPAGTTITPLFDVWGGLTDATPVGVVPFDPATMVASADGTLTVPMLLPRLAAGETVQYDFAVTSPASGNYDLSVLVADCVLPEAGTARAWMGSVARAGWSDDACTDALIDAMLGSLLSFLPGGPCAGLVYNTVLSTVKNYATGPPPASVVSFTSVLADNLGLLSCVASLVPGGQLAGLLLDGVANLVTISNLLQNCFTPSPPPVPQQQVSSYDPNELVGPPGGGAQHVRRSGGEHEFSVYFENLATATAPAQEVRAELFLDPAKYDLSTVEIGEVAFGDFRWSPAGLGDPELDERIDLPRVDGLQLDITTTVDEGTGEVEWLLQSVDPLTGALPQDPDQGFLPPNVDGTEGQAVVHLTVEPLALTSGTLVESDADIYFDLNPVISTNQWVNLIDDDAPTGAVSSLPATASATSFPVTWTSSDPTSGVAGIDLYAAVDGGPLAFWKSVPATGSASYDGQVGHSYGFAAVATDLAGNRSVLPATPQSSTSVVAPPGPPTTPPAPPAVPSAPTLTAKVSVHDGVVVLKGRLLVAGAPVARASLKIKEGSRTLAKDRTKSNGKWSVRLQDLAPGRHVFKVVYAGSGSVEAHTVKVRVQV